MKCPNCTTESNGRYCPSCGTPLRDANCTNCDAALVPGARFCTQCGRAVDAHSRVGPGAAVAAEGSNTAWYIAAGVLGLIVIVLAVPMLRGGDDALPGTPLGQLPGIAPGAGPGSMPGVAPGSPPPLTGTPREQADRLFNRIMTAREQGNIDEARFFTPMATQAYGAAEPLDADGLYHLATIHIVAADAASALRTAERILASEPNHLLGLAVAAEAAALGGDSSAALGYQRRLLEAYDTEFARGLTEYRDHATILPEYRAAARRAVGS